MGWIFGEVSCQCGLLDWGAVSQKHTSGNYWQALEASQDLKSSPVFVRRWKGRSNRCFFISWYQACRYHKQHYISPIFFPDFSPFDAYREDTVWWTLPFNNQLPVLLHTIPSPNSGTPWSQAGMTTLLKLFSWELEPSLPPKFSPSQEAGENSRSTETRCAGLPLFISNSVTLFP